MIFSESLAGFTIWHGANDYGGSVTSGKPPEMNRKTADRRPGGLQKSVKTRHGWEDSPLEIGLAGLTDPMFDFLNGATIGQHTVFLRGAFEDEINGGTKTALLEFRGRANKLMLPDEMKADEDAEGKIEFDWIFYQLTYGGEEKIFFDVLNNVVRLNGTDEADGIRQALGRA